MNIKSKKQTSRSLSSLLSILLVALSIGTLVVLTAVQLYANLGNQRKAVYERQQLIAQDAKKSVNNFFQEKFKVLETATELTNIIELSSDEKQITLDGLLGLQPSFRQLVLLDINHQLLTSSSRLSQTAINPISERLTNEALSQIQSGKNYISPVYIDDATSEPLVIIAIPVQNIFKEFQGTLAAEVNLKFMWDLVDQLHVGETGYAYVVDEKGDLIAYRDTTLVLKGENVSYIDAVQSILSAPGIVKADTAIHKGLSGENVVTNYDFLGTPPWAIVVELPVQEAYQNIFDQGIFSLLFTIGLALVASLLSIFAARRLATPIIQLTQIANRIANGELDLQATARGSLEVESLATAFNAMTSQLRNLIGDLEQRVIARTTDFQIANQRNERRARQFEAVAQVARATTANENIDELLPRLTSVISDQFGFYHTGIFLLDENHENAVLQATNSEGGKRMLDRKHKLPIGQTGLVGFVSATGNPRIALDVGTDAVFFDNPDLPNTRSEMALPLHVAGEIVGVLDVQSMESNAFQQEDIEVLSTLADQVSIAIQNARSFESTQQLLQDAQKESRSYLQDAWRVSQSDEAYLGYRVSGNEIQNLNKQVDSDNAKKAIRIKQTIIENGQSASLAVPIRLRDEVIGIMDIRIPEEHEWDQDEVDITEAVAERLSIALESAMLLKSTQRRAEFERVTADISGKIGSTTQFNSILRTAAEELSRVLGGSDVLVQIQSPDSKIISKDISAEKQGTR